MSKNPYECRLETLKMAKEMLDQQYFLKENLLHRMMDQAQERRQSVKDAYEKYMPIMYSPQDIINKATELNSYISEKQ